MRRAAACLLAAATLAGCGGTTEVREPDVVVKGAAAPSPSAQGQPRRDQRPRIVVVTHGQAADAFWQIVRNGIDAAERQVDVQVDYEAPDVFSNDRMRRLIEQAVASRPDGLVVSIPNPEVLGPIRAAVRAGIPVVSINSGSDVSLGLGTLAHVGQPEERAGLLAGRRLVAAGAKNALCVNHEIGNDGLDRRCMGFARALREAGGVSRVLAVDTKDVAATRRRLATAAGRDGVDGVLTLNNTAGEIAADSVPRRVVLGTFDYSPGVLAALRSGRMEFAVDQQPYLQGYLPIVLLAEKIRYGLFPAEGQVIPTGPSFVTRENAAQAKRLIGLGVR